jgi:hypothetical protein
MKKLALNCFSPPVMLATFLFEIGAMLYIIMRGRATRTMWPISLTLACLGFFQLAEWMVCETAWGLSSLDWARLGFVAISFLPALGLDTGYRLRGKVDGVRYVVMVGYGVALAFSAYFWVLSGAITASQCLGNYVLFHTPGAIMNVYGLYYYSWLLFTVGWLIKGRPALKELWRRQASLWMALGLMAFLLPVTIANLLYPETFYAIPSIMCGFAVALAAVLLFKVFPLVRKNEK